MPDYDERLIRLEEAIVFQERLIKELNEALTEQQLQINRQEKELQAVRALVLNLYEAVNEDRRQTTELPPHYL